MPFPDPPARMSYRSRFRQQLFVELAFSERHLRPLIRLFRQLQTEDLPDSFHFDALEGLDPAMTWQYAMNGRTLAPFELCLRQSNLNRSLRIVDDAMLFAACFIVVDGGISPRGFHIDYGEPDIPPTTARFANTGIESGADCCSTGNSSIARRLTTRRRARSAFSSHGVSLRPVRSTGGRLRR